jgi:gluconokinase
MVSAVVGSRDAVAGLDVGTTGTQAVVLDLGGRVLGAASRRHPLMVSAPPRAEQDPEILVESAVGALSEASREAVASGADIVAVALSSAMHSLIGIDASGRPLTPVITWADNRAARETKALRKWGGATDLYRRTGTPIHPMSPLTKLMWFKDNAPAVNESVRKWISIKEYVLGHLLDEYMVDHAVASATGLFDIHRRAWDPEALELAGIDSTFLSEAVPTMQVAGELSDEWSGRLNLRAGTPLVIGASDGALENLGAGAIRPGSGVMTIGTSGALRACVSEPAAEEQGRLFCYAFTDDRWVVGGPVNNGGITLDWLLNELFTDLKADNRGYGELDRLAAAAPPGSAGLLFLPYLLGERAPDWNSNARAVFFGLTAEHGRKHVVRAAMEGVVHQLHQVHRVLISTIGRLRVLRATGGFAHSPVWRQIAADMFGMEIGFPPTQVSSSCRGAAWLGMAAVGLLDSLESVDRLVTYEHMHHPHPSPQDVYARADELFARLYDRVRDLFEELVVQEGPQPRGDQLL